jgi:glycine dehydrogenase subunit 2
VKYDKLIYELSIPGRRAYNLPEQDLPELDLTQVYDPALLRQEAPGLPEVSELDVVRHYTNLSKLNFGVENGFYPLGSCTMKYNPKINDEVASLDGFRNIHPLQSGRSVQPLLRLYGELADMLTNISGMDATSLNPFAGAHGELTGLMIMKAYHERRGDIKRTKMIIPDSAHGTNPASAAMLGFDCITIKSTPKGLVDLEALKAALSEEVAGIMLTNPNTLGLFETDILEISRLVHEAGGLLYYDGANLNALLGVARPGDMGFDIMHMNLHKTFSTPHGGGGPGSGPVSVKKHLADLLPNPRIVKKGRRYEIEHNPNAIGQIGGFYGNFLVCVRAYAYLKSIGTALNKVGPYAVLNANYVKEKLRDRFALEIEAHYMHEFVFNGLIDQSTGVRTLDVAKRLLDYGVHAPTIYFPLLFEQSIMIEPTESESQDTLDQFIDIMTKIAEEAKHEPDCVKLAPHLTPVGRLDEVNAARHPILKFKDYEPNV